jgi:PIN domain nuclease of toxin-antitoxin system
LSAVVDASALLCLLLDEPGADTVAAVIRGAHISTVNVSESCSRGVERGATIAAVLRAVERFELTVHPFDLQLARRTAELRAPTRRAGIALGDRACLALGERLGTTVYTGDRRLAASALDIGIEVRLIR